MKIFPSSSRQSSTRPSSADPSFAIEVVNECFAAAIQRGASDIHFQPRSARWEISFRIDGVLQVVDSIERDEESDPVSRLMALAGLPSYRGSVPLEGPLRWTGADGRCHEMRLGVFPTVHGRRAAIRIMEDRHAIRQLNQLGFDDGIDRQLRSICDARDGWLLVAGPAGSGKTTTLYACLSQIASGEFRRSVLTIEDPVEAVIDAISQSQLQPESGLSLASAMRSAVRQDAEVLLVSEIRDVETADAVLAASMTGHLCFSSIHAGSVGATLRRLVQMKLPAFAIQSGLRGILCQRLLRRRCTTCGGQDPESCHQCHGTGYWGRLPIAQMVTFDGTSIGPAVFEALLGGSTADEIDSIAARAGVETLHEQAARLVEQGETDSIEVFRVLGREP